MANTGSFPIAIESTATPPRAALRAGSRDGRVAALGLIGIFLLGSGAAAAGIHWESEGYGALSIAGGAVIGLGGALPVWLLFRRR